MVGLVPGRDWPAVGNLPGDIMAAAYLLSGAYERIAVLV
jgi:hypothetical protein